MTRSALVLRIRLFLSSYALLFAMLAVRFTELRLRLACGALALGGALTLWLAMRAARKISPAPHQIVAVADQGPGVAGYLVAYLLPLLTVPEPRSEDLVAYGLFLLVVGVIYVRSEMVQINPLLYVFGYRVSSVRTQDGWVGFLVSRHPPAVGDRRLASRLQNTLAVESRAGSDG